MNEDLKKVKQGLDRFNAEFGRCAMYVSEICCVCASPAVDAKVVAVLHSHKVQGIDFEYACVSVCGGCVKQKEVLKFNVQNYIKRDDLDAIII